MLFRSLEPGFVGAWRDRIGWIGGPTPHRAAFVPPPPELIAAFMDDLVAFANDDHVDPVTQAGIVHAQFETIHPFADGNGRIGRILIGWVLRRRLGLAGLTRYRIDGPEPWVLWFAQAVERTAYATEAVLADVARIVGGWPARLDGLRADAAARRIVAHLPTHLAVDVATAASLAGVSGQAARSALDELVNRGVLRDGGAAGKQTGRPRRWWVAGELLDRLGAG